MRRGAALTVVSGGLAVVALLCAGCGGVSSANKVENDPIDVQPVNAFHPPIRTEVASGDTIESVCRRLAGDDWVVWRDALVEVLDPRKLRPGTVFEGRCTPGGELERLSVVLDRRSELQLRSEAHGITVERIDRPVESRVVRLEGLVASSLFGAVQQAGGHAAAIDGCHSRVGTQPGGRCRNVLLAAIVVEQGRGKGPGLARGDCSCFRRNHNANW